MTLDPFLALGSGLAGAAVAIGAGRVVPAWDAISRRRIASMTDMTEALGVRDDHLTFGLRVWGLVLVAVPLLFGPGLRMYVLILPVFLLAFQAPKWILSEILSDRKTKLRDQLATLCLSLANTARSGLSLPKGLEEEARKTEWPLRTEIGRIVDDIRRGRVVEDAVRESQQRLRLDTFHVFANVVLIAFESGASYPEALEKVGHSLQENQKLERKLASETAAGRKVVLYLAGFPVVFLAMFYLIDPDSTSRVFSTVFGQCVLAVVGFLTFLSVKLTRKIMAIEI